MSTVNAFNRFGSFKVIVAIGPSCCKVTKLEAARDPNLVLTKPILVDLDSDNIDLDIKDNIIYVLKF